QPRNEERNSKKNGRWTRKKSGSESQEPRLADFSAACEAVPYKDLVVVIRGLKHKFPLALNVAAEAATHKDFKALIQALQTEL
ncbi:MAG: hypothetical protein WCA19_19855, partial [Candidatus Acidiferrales bacterium]